MAGPAASHVSVSELREATGEEKATTPLADEPSSSYRPLEEPLLRHSQGRNAEGGLRGEQQQQQQQYQGLLPTLLWCCFACLGAFSFGYAVGYTSPALASLSADLRLPPALASLFSSLITVGAMLGASLPLLLSSRVINGLGVGLASYVVPVYIAEVAPHAWRGALGSLNQLAITVGMLGVYSAGLALPWRPLATLGALPAVALLLGVAAAPESPRWLARRGAGRGEVLRVLLRLRGVRAAADAADAAAADAADAAAADAADAAAADAAAAAAAVGGGVGAAGIVSSSCSPAAAAAVAAECEEILQGVQQEKGGEETGEGWEREGGSGSGEAEQEGVVESGGVGMRAVGGGKKGAGSKGVWDLSKELLFGHARRPFALCVGLMVLQQCAGINAIVFFAAAIFRNAGFTNPNLPSFGIAAVQVLFTVCSALLLDRAGRRVLLLLSSSGMALSCLLLGLSFYLPHAHLPFLPASSAPLLAFSGCMAYIVFYSMGMGGIPWIIMSEIIPAHMRSLAGSLVVLCNWSLCFLITQTFAVLFAWSSYGTVWLYGTVAAVGVAFIWYCVPETKGRSLEEIEAFFRPENDSYQ